MCQWFSNIFHAFFINVINPSWKDRLVVEWVEYCNGIPNRISPNITSVQYGDEIESPFYDWYIRWRIASVNSLKQRMNIIPSTAAQIHFDSQEIPVAELFDK